MDGRKNARIPFLNQEEENRENSESPAKQQRRSHGMLSRSSSNSSNSPIITPTATRNNTQAITHSGSSELLILANLKMDTETKIELPTSNSLSESKKEEVKNEILEIKDISTQEAQQEPTANFITKLNSFCEKNGYETFCLPTAGVSNFKFDLNNEKHVKTIKFLENYARTLAPDKESYNPNIHINGIATGTSKSQLGMIIFKKENPNTHEVEYFFQLRSLLFKDDYNLKPLNKNKEHVFVLLFKNYRDIPTNWQEGINIPYHIEVRTYVYSTTGHPYLMGVDDNLLTSIIQGELKNNLAIANDQTGGLHDYALLEINKDEETKQIVYEVLTTLIFGTRYVPYAETNKNPLLLNKQSIFASSTVESSKKDNNEKMDVVKNDTKHHYQN